MHRLVVTNKGVSAVILCATGAMDTLLVRWCGLRIDEGTLLSIAASQSCPWLAPLNFIDIQVVELLRISGGFDWTLLGINMEFKVIKKSILTALLGLTGCSSIIHGGHDTVTINSLEKGATIYVDNIPRGADIIQVDLERGEAHTVRASKDGCTDTMVPVTDKFDPTSLLGIFLDFGIISLPVDFISGSAWKIAPRTYTVTPICKAKKA